ncbi:hypothetical protein DFP73DRAFT_591447 [Morchella snyderi]|nr:hypothetical protein DFP73DRAFT_591447 [Morchella snyderi]
MAVSLTYAGVFSVLKSTQCSFKSPLEEANFVSPSIPVSPAIPVSPVIPVSPATPVSPVTPVFPAIPASPPTLVSPATSVDEDVRVQGTQSKQEA